MEDHPRYIKRFKLEAPGKNFRVQISELNGFYASCLWHDEGRMLKAPEEGRSLNFYLETKFATTAEAAEQQIF